MEEALSNWVLQCQHKKVAITYAVIIEKANRLATLLNLGATEFSNGSMQKFLSRNHLHSVKMNGESGSVNMQAVTTNIEEIQHKVASFQPADVYNMDESGLFYEYAPDRTIAQYRLEGLKKSKKRFTIAFTANADRSHKLKHFFIRHAK